MIKQGILSILSVFEWQIFCEQPSGIFFTSLILQKSFYYFLFSVFIEIIVSIYIVLTLTWPRAWHKYSEWRRSYIYHKSLYCFLENAVEGIGSISFTLAPPNFGFAWIRISNILKPVVQASVVRGRRFCSTNIEFSLKIRW